MLNASSALEGLLKKLSVLEKANDLVKKETINVIAAPAVNIINILKNRTEYLRELELEVQAHTDSMKHLDNENWGSF